MAFLIGNTRVFSFQQLKKIRTLLIGRRDQRSATCVSVKMARPENSHRSLVHFVSSSLRLENAPSLRSGRFFSLNELSSLTNSKGKRHIGCCWEKTDDSLIKNRWTERKKGDPWKRTEPRKDNLIHRCARSVLWVFFHGSSECFFHSVHRSWLWILVTSSPSFGWFIVFSCLSL